MTEATDLHPKRAEEIQQLIDDTAAKVMKPHDLFAERGLVFDARATPHDPPLDCFSCNLKTGRSLNGYCKPCFVAGKHFEAHQTDAEKVAATPVVLCGFCGKPHETMVVQPSGTAKICPTCVVQIFGALSKAGKLPGLPAPPVALSSSAAGPSQVSELVSIVVEMGKLAAEAAQKLDVSDRAALRARALADMAETLAQAAVHVHGIIGGK